MWMFYMSNNLNLFKSDNEDHSTPLHFASENGGVEIVEMLIEAGADIEAQDR